jgi:hypothetical protein
VRRLVYRMMEVHRGLRALALLFLLLSISASVKLHAQSSDDGLPAFSQGWTDQEKTAFQNCVSNISDSSRENTMQLSADSYACLIHEEQQHWMNLHPQAHGKKENHAKEHKCFAKHPLQVKGTAEEFHSSFDLCMCAAYGMPMPKP